MLMKNRLFKRNRKVRMISILVLLIGPLLLASCSSSNADDSPDEIVVYQMMRQYCEVAEDTIDKVMLEKYNTVVKCQNLASAEAYSKVQSERENPVASVVVGDAIGVAAGVEADYYEELDPEVVTNMELLEGYPREAFGNEAVAIANETINMAYRKDLFEEKGIPAPTKWEDLYNPDLKSEVGMFSAGISAPYSLVLNLAKIAGGDVDNIDPGFEKANELAESGQIGSFYDSGSMMYQGLSTGEIMVGPTYLAGAADLTEIDENVELVFPEDGFAHGLYIAAVIKDSPNQDKAQQYINLLLSEEYQKAIAEERSTSPIRGDLDLSDELSTKILAGSDGWEIAHQVDWIKLSSLQNEWYNRWIREVEQK